MATQTRQADLAPIFFPDPGPVLRRHGTALVFWGLTALYLVPVWAFTYLPTQDGPAHLASALALKDYHLPGSRYHEFVAVRSGPLPNWLAHHPVSAWLWSRP